MAAAAEKQSICNAGRIVLQGLGVKRTKVDRSYDGSCIDAKHMQSRQRIQGV